MMTCQHLLSLPPPLFAILSIAAHEVSISRLVSSGAANKIEIAAADNYLSLRDH
jgi:hypothetical protein